jgi:hypothetical protein
MKTVATETSGQTIILADQINTEARAVVHEELKAFNNASNADFRRASIRYSRTRIL